MSEFLFDYQSHIVNVWKALMYCYIVKHEYPTGFLETYRGWFVAVPIFIEFKMRKLLDLFLLESCCLKFVAVFPSSSEKLFISVMKWIIEMTLHSIFTIDFIFSFFPLQFPECFAQGDQGWLPCTQNPLIPGSGCDYSAGCIYNRTRLSVSLHERRNVLTYISSVIQLVEATSFRFLSHSALGFTSAGKNFCICF